MHASFTCLPYLQGHLEHHNRLKFSYKKESGSLVISRKTFRWFIFHTICIYSKYAKICTIQKFPAIHYYLHVKVKCRKRTPFPNVCNIAATLARAKYNDCLCILQSKNHMYMYRETPCRTKKMKVAIHTQTLAFCALASPKNWRTSLATSKDLLWRR